MSPRNRVFARLAMSAAALSLIGCAGPLHRTPQGNYKIDGPSYEIAALPGGRLMPEGWVLKNYEEKDGKFSNNERYEHNDLVFTREADDAWLRMGAGDSEPCDWSAQPGYCHLAAGIYDPPVVFELPGTGYAIRATRPYSTANVEGVETLADRVTQSGSILVRIYQLWFHDRASKHFVLLTVLGQPKQIAAVGNDVAGLVKRISFP